MEKKKIAAGMHYLILSKESGLALTAMENEEVKLFAPGDSAVQLWKAVKAGDGYKLKNRATGRMLDATLSGGENGAPVAQYEEADAENQIWFLIPDGECFALQNSLYGQFLDVVGISKTEGATLQLWEGTEGANQQWEIRAVKLTAKKAPAKKTPAKKAPAKKKTAAKTKE